MNNKPLTQKIAELLDAERPAVDLSAIMDRLDELSVRLEKLETVTVEIPRSAIRLPRADHPSLDKLSIAEAIADQIFAGAGKEKACSFEPNGKPCDHCSMCNSRGF